jgi:hypothetical protein
MTKSAAFHHILDNYVLPHCKTVVSKSMDEFRKQWFGDTSLLDSLAFVNRGQFQKLFEKVSGGKPSIHLSLQQVSSFKKVFGIMQLGWDKIVH